MGQRRKNQNTAGIAMGLTITSALNSKTNSNNDELIKEDSFQFNNSVGKFNSRSRKTTTGKGNTTPLVDVQNNNIPTHQRGRGRGLRDRLGVDSAIENVAGGEKPPERRSNRIKAKNLQCFLDKEIKYNSNTSKSVVLEDVNCALTLSELPKQKRASKRRFVSDGGSQLRINKRICVQNGNVARSLTEKSSINKDNTVDAVLVRQTMEESQVMPTNEPSQRPPSSGLGTDAAETGSNSVRNSPDKIRTKRDCVPKIYVARSPTAKSNANKENMIDAVLGRQTMEESQAVHTNDPPQRPPLPVKGTEAVEMGSNSVLNRPVEMTEDMHVVSDDDGLPDGLCMEGKSLQKCQVNDYDGHLNGITFAKVHKWYSKLHTKYKELKERKLDDVEAYIKEQNEKFTAYVNAAEELLEHLRNENNYLQSEANEVNSTLALNRIRQLEHKNAECQNDLLLERSKNLALIKEVKRLRLMLSEQKDMSKQDQNINLPFQSNSTQCLSCYEGTNSCSQEKSVVLQPEGHESIVDLSCVGPEYFSKCFPSYSRLKEASVQTEMVSNKCLSCCLESRATIEEPESRLVCNEAARKSTKVSSQVDFEYTSTQVDKQNREDTVKGDGASGGSANANRLFQTLLQCMVGLKFTIVEEGNQLQLSILQESSGYSFKLKYLSVEDDPHFRENGELLYHTVSLGTLQKIAPDWMKEDIIFSIGQVNVFFDRILQVTNGRGHNLLVYRTHNGRFCFVIRRGWLTNDPPLLFELESSCIMAQESWNREKEETGCQVSEGLIRCANNCGFFRSATTMSLCSKCYREFVLLNNPKSSFDKPQQIQGEVSIPRPDIGAEEIRSEYPAVDGSGPSCSATAYQPKTLQQQNPPPLLPRQTNRCFSCRKRVGLTRFRCRCGDMFCALHRYSDKHNCTYDYKTAGRDAIAKANPLVKADKIQRF